ncbi:hypothetical protein BGZ80_008402 [Entomortierella chlamydospora]|uniref:FAS1 domain-containing protein n=1 Tax=Entomortierella chlamydospora TaxID=101097 RepID=A0A9P6T169_9FUNG|nr:hypothetical protein BGZ80_008402 [Entomortierella chlamydospora]
MKIQTNAARLLLLLTTLLFAATPVLATTKVIDLISSDASFSRLIKELQRLRLVVFLNDRKTCTFFAPTNAAFSKWDAANPGRRIDRGTLLYHILPDSVLTPDMRDAMLLETMYVREGYLGDHKEGQIAQVSKPIWRPGRKVQLLIGGAEILKNDWQADNGVVHVIDRLLTPPVDLADTIQKHAELSTIYNLIHSTGLDDLLHHHLPFTLFAPTTDALKKLNDIQVRYLRHDQGRKDLEITFHHHIHVGTIYIQDIQKGSSSISTLEGQELMVNLDDKLLVDNAEVEKKDIIAANGVIHKVSRPLLPSALVWTAGKYLVGLNATKFVDALREAGLSHYVDDPEAKLLNGRAQRSKVNVRREDKQAVILIDDVEIKGEPVQVGKSLVYLVARPLEPPIPLIKKIKKEQSLSVFAQALSATGLSRRLSDARGVTVFAPNAEAWTDLGVVTNYLMLNDSVARDALEAVARYTIVEDVIYTPDIKSGRTVLRTSQGSELVMEKSNGAIYVGEGRLERSLQVGGKITGKDTLVDSGVIQAVSAVALPPTLSITLFNVLQGAGTQDFLQAFQTSNITQILTNWEQDFTIFAPTDEAFRKAGLEGALNDKDFVARLVRLHVLPGKILNLEEDMGDDEASMLNTDARLSVRDIHGDGKNFGVRVKGARSRREANIIGSGRAHPAWPTDEYGRRPKVVNGMRQQNAADDDQDSYITSEMLAPQPSGVIYVIDRVLLPGDPEPLGGTWFWIAVISVGVLLTINLFAFSGFLLHALVKEIRQLEGYQPVAADEEAGAPASGDAAPASDDTAPASGDVAAAGGEA